MTHRKEKKKPWKRWDALSKQTGMLKAEVLFEEQRKVLANCFNFFLSCCYHFHRCRGIRSLKKLTSYTSRDMPDFNLQLHFKKYSFFDEPCYKTTHAVCNRALNSCRAGISLRAVSFSPQILFLVHFIQSLYFTNCCFLQAFKGDEEIVNSNKC